MLWALIAPFEEHAMSRVWIFAAACLLVVAPGCKPPSAEQQSAAEAEVSADTSPESADAFMPEDATPQERQYLQAGKEFYLAIAGREYGRAYDMLSPFALQNVHPYQFSPPEEETRGQEPPRLAQLTKEAFVTYMQQVEEKYGRPREVDSLWVEETDAQVLAGKGDNLSVMWAIGMIPDSVPVEIRKAALRGQLQCRFNEEALKELMAETGMTEKQIEEDSDLFPYFSLKTVLVEDGGKLAIGYLEFVGPSILD
jgi:hypothetical protein